MAYGTTLNGIRGAGGIPNLVTTLYNGNGAARDIITGQDLASGGLVWGKNRSTIGSHYLVNNIRIDKALQSNSTAAEIGAGTIITQLKTNGFGIGTDPELNDTGDTYVAWSFLQKAGFMDIVEYVGNGAGARIISHNLGTTPALMIAKATSTTSNWWVQHKDAGTSGTLILNDTTAYDPTGNSFNNSAPTSSGFTVANTGGNSLNALSETYIAYLFAHNPAQKIYCGSFTTDGSGNATVTGLGFRPKWLLVKQVGVAGGFTGAWVIVDVERGWGSGSDGRLYPHLSFAEELVETGYPTSNGFVIDGAFENNGDYIYMAIG